MAEDLSGVLAASVTPLSEEDSIDVDRWAEHVQWLLANGCDGVLLFGTTGEGLSFSVDERMQGLEALLDAGIPPNRLMVGTGASALPDAVRLSRHATRQGVAGVLVLPFFHYGSVSDAAIERGFRHLIDGVSDPDLRLFFYHFPGMYRVGVSFPVIQRLLDAYPKQIAGVKDSTGEWDHTEALVRGFPNLRIFAGTERLLRPVLKAGGAGCISATVNLTAPLAGRVASGLRAGTDVAKAADTLARLRSELAAFPLVPALKQALAWRDAAPGWTRVRPPLTTMETPKTLRDVAQSVQNALA